MQNVFLDNLILDLRRNNCKYNSFIVKNLLFNYVNLGNKLVVGKYLVFKDFAFGSGSITKHDIDELVDFLNFIHVTDFIFAEESTATLDILYDILSDTRFKFKDVVFVRGSKNTMNWGSYKGILIHLKKGSK